MGEYVEHEDAYSAIFYGIFDSQRFSPDYVNFIESEIENDRYIEETLDTLFSFKKNNKNQLGSIKFLFSKELINDHIELVFYYCIKSNSHNLILLKYLINYSLYELFIEWINTFKHIILAKYYKLRLFEKTTNYNQYLAVKKIIEM